MRDHQGDDLQGPQADACHLAPARRSTSPSSERLALELASLEMLCISSEVKTGQALLRARAPYGAHPTSCPGAESLEDEMRVFALAIGLGVSAYGGSRWRGRRAESRADEPGRRFRRRRSHARSRRNGLKAHLAALAAIAARNGGTRAVGTSGYSDSVAYVTRQLRAVGYRPAAQDILLRLLP